MLRINKVDIRGFGPYINQSVSFKTEKGVNIIWGDNGYGKTTFINALKFGFFGELPDESNKDKSIISLINVHNKNKGYYHFSVIIEFQLEMDTYILTRYGKPQFDEIEPEGYNDFQISFNLQKNGNLLSQNEAKMTISRIMPENTSRFFIFDGELLEEYNKLTEDSETSFRLKESIEQILGLPILSNSKRHIDDIKDVTSRKLLELSKEFSQDRKNYNKWERESKKLKDRNEERNDLLKSKEKYEKEFESIINEIKQGPSGEKLKDYEKQSSLRDLKLNEINSKTDLIKDLVNSSWRGLTSQRLYLYKQEANTFIKQFEEKQITYNAISSRIDLFKISLSKQNCETCDRGLDLTEINAMNKQITKLENTYPSITNEERDTYNKYVKSVQLIDEKLSTHKTDATLISTLVKEIDELEIEVFDLEETMRRIKKSIDNFNEEQETNIILENRREKALENLTNVNSAIKDITEDINKISDEVKKLENIIKEEINEDELTIFKEKESILEDFSKLIEEGIDVFRNQLKDRVEKDAEKLFLKFSNQKDFVGLKINDNYGLDIVQKSGYVVPVKSSGYSHIVSLCLIGALHKNAPVQGPVFIDSPSGRLDQHHKNNLINILTDISDQVVLLLYNEELDVNLIRKNLGSSLLNEFELVHDNDDAFTTSINER